MHTERVGLSVFYNNVTDEPLPTEKEIGMNMKLKDLSKARKGERKNKVVPLQKVLKEKLRDSDRDTWVSVGQVLPDIMDRLKRRIR